MYRGEELKNKYEELQVRMKAKHEECELGKDTLRETREQKAVADLQNAKLDKQLKQILNERDNQVEIITRYECQMLERTTEIDRLREKYLAMVEADKHRLDTNVDVGLQTMPETVEMCIQTEFITPDMSMRQQNSWRKTPQRYGGGCVITPQIVTQAHDRPKTVGDSAGRSGMPQLPQLPGIGWG
jgi:superfamily II RNA helicase